ncbi:MAG: XRE family transcriptional regulator [Eubacterium sp.]|nr:XRE family transcriptional regulator [Eubacterium sp.]
MDELQQRKKIISRLVEARLEQGISQAELARRIGTQRSNINRLESGEHNPSLDMIVRIAVALGKDISLELQDKEDLQSNVYSLRLYNTELLRFSMEKQGLAGLVSEILYINEAQKHLLPLDMTLTGEGIIRWLEHRVIPKNRTFVDEILKSLGLSHNDTKGIIDVCKGLSLNDSYWVVPEDFDGDFSRYNLYENRFSEILALVAYTGAGGSRQAFTTSPELTTGGMLPKAWRYAAQDGIYLYKGGTTGASNAGREPYCEYYASQIAERMQLNAVHYDLENWKGITASKCALFTDIDTAYIPIGRIVKRGGIAACLDFYDNLGPEFSEHLCSTLVFDALIYNEDRHFGNFGVLRDNRSGNIIAPAPIFDNGLSLFCYAGKEDYANLKEYAKTRTTPYNISYEDVCAEVMGPRQRAQLRRMIGFRFKRHKSLNLPEEHLQAIEKQLESRVIKLLSIPSARR